MPSPLSEPFDVEALLRSWLTEADTDLYELAGDEVGTELPSTWDAGDTYLKLSRIGGTVDVGFDRPNVQFDAYAATKAEANALARAAIARILELAGQAVPLGFVSWVEPTLGLSWAPDPITDAPRYLFGFRLYGQPRRPAYPAELALYRAGRALVEAAPLDIVVYGNSISQGTGLADVADAWPNALGALLADALTDETSGGYYLPAVPPSSGAPTNAAWALTNNTGSAGYGPIGDQGLGDHAISILNIGATTDTLAITARFTDLTIVVSQFNSTFGGGILADSVEVLVDGNLDLTFDPRDPSMADNTYRSHYTEELTGYTDEDHDVVIRPAGTAGAINLVIVEGIYAHSGNLTAGPRVWNGGHAFYPLGGNTNKPRGFDIIDELEPALVIVQHQYNNRIGTVAAYATNLDELATRLAEKTHRPSVLVTSEHRNQTWTPANADWDELRSTLAEKADLYGWAFLDLGGPDLVGDLGFDGTPNDPCDFLSPDPTSHHPGTAGAAYLAARYADVLLEDLYPTTPYCPSA